MMATMLKYYIYWTLSSLISKCDMIYQNTIFYKKKDANSIIKSASFYVFIDIVGILCYNNNVKREGGVKMDEHISEIIKDLSEAFLAIVSSICLIITTARKKSKKSKSKSRKRVKR